MVTYFLADPKLPAILLKEFDARTKSKAQPIDFSVWGEERDGGGGCMWRWVRHTPAFVIFRVFKVHLAALISKEPCLVVYLLKEL